jgi:hypothetical protein
LFRYAVAALAVGIALAGCSGGARLAERPSNSGVAHRSAPKPVPMSALDGLVVGADDIDAVMGTTGMTPHPPFRQMADHRNLMPNLNCLGIWQIGESAIYGTSNFAAVRGQLLREPDDGDWNSLVIQAVVSYLSADAAQKFFAASSDRWSRCSNHRVNITYTGYPQTAWSFGTLTKTDTELTMPLTRSRNGGRACQRALAVDDNVIVDVAACAQTITDQASRIVDEIRSRIPA